MYTAVICFEWLVFGLFAAFEFGKIAVQGVMLPFVLSAIFALVGMFAIVILVGKAVASRKPLALILLGAISLTALLLSAWQMDIITSASGRSGTINENSMLGAVLYFLVSLAIVGVGLLIVWARHKLHMRRMNRQAFEKAYEDRASELVYMPTEQALRELDSHNKGQGKNPVV